MDNKKLKQSKSLIHDFIFKQPEVCFKGGMSLMKSLQILQLVSENIEIYIIDFKNTSKL